MKRIALLVLVLIANVIADEKKDIETLATDLETDTQTIELCLSEIGETLEEINISRQKWDEIEDEKDIDEETKKSLMIYCRFIACIMEKTNKMKDTKIVLDKVLEVVNRWEQNISKVKYDEEILTKCVNSLNENEMTPDDRSFGLMFCFINSEKEA